MLRVLSISTAWCDNRSGNCIFGGFLRHSIGLASKQSGALAALCYARSQRLGAVLDLDIAATAVLCDSRSGWLRSKRGRLWRCATLDLYGLEKVLGDNFVHYLLNLERNLGHFVEHLLVSENDGDFVQPDRKFNRKGGGVWVCNVHWKRAFTEFVRHSVLKLGGHGGCCLKLDGQWILIGTRSWLWHFVVSLTARDSPLKFYLLGSQVVISLPV